MPHLTSTEDSTNPVQIPSSLNETIWCKLSLPGRSFYIPTGVIWKMASILFFFKYKGVAQQQYSYWGNTNPEASRGRSSCATHPEPFLHFHKPPQSQPCQGCEGCGGGLCLRAATRISLQSLPSHPSPQPGRKTPSMETRGEPKGAVAIPGSKQPLPFQAWLPGQQQQALFRN